MSLLSATGINIQPTFKSVGDYVGRFGRFGHHCWETKESVRETYYNEIRPAILAHLDRRVGSVSSQSSVIISSYMMGRRAATAAPTVLFVSEDASCRKEARKVIKDSGILSPYRGWKTAEASIDPRWGGNLEQLASGQRVSDARFSQSPATRVLYDPSQSISAQGMTLYLELNSEIRTFTANFILVNGVPSYLGPAHAFFPKTDPPTSYRFDPVHDFEIDSDDETETIWADDQSPDFTIIESDSEAESSEDDSDSSMEFSDFEAYSQSSVDSFEQETSVLSIPHDNASDPAEVKPSSFVREAYTPSLDSLAPFGVLSQWSTDKDWALIEVERENDALIEAFCAGNHDDLGSLETARPGPAGAAVVTQTTSGGRLVGTISGTTSDIRVPYGHTFQEVFSVKLDGFLADGDCGSMVLDAHTGELYGHIVAGCRATGFAYVMAASEFLPDLSIYRSEKIEESEMADTHPINVELAHLVPQSQSASSVCRANHLRDPLWGGYDFERLRDTLRQDYEYDFGETPQYVSQYRLEKSHTKPESLNKRAVVIEDIEARADTQYVDPGRIPYPYYLSPLSDLLLLSLLPPLDILPPLHILPPLSDHCLDDWLESDHLQNTQSLPQYHDLGPWNYFNSRTTWMRDHPHPYTQSLSPLQRLEGENFETLLNESIQLPRRPIPSAAQLCQSAKRSTFVFRIRDLADGYDDIIVYDHTPRRRSRNSGTQTQNSNSSSTLWLCNGTAVTALREDEVRDKRFQMEHQYSARGRFSWCLNSTGFPQFFREGKVFAMLSTEPPDGTALDNSGNDLYTTITSGEWSLALGAYASDLHVICMLLEGDRESYLHAREVRKFRTLFDTPFNDHLTGLFAQCHLYKDVRMETLMSIRRFFVVPSIDVRRILELAYAQASNERSKGCETARARDHTQLLFIWFCPAHAAACFLLENLELHDHVARNDCIARFMRHHPSDKHPPSGNHHPSHNVVCYIRQQTMKDSGVAHEPAAQDAYIHLLQRHLTDCDHFEGDHNHGTNRNHPADPGQGQTSSHESCSVESLTPQPDSPCGRSHCSCNHRSAPKFSDLEAGDSTISHNRAMFVGLIDNE